jgi:hypothetical protein
MLRSIFGVSARLKYHGPSWFYAESCTWRKRLPAVGAVLRCRNRKHFAQGRINRECWIRDSDGYVVVLVCDVGGLFAL